MNAQNGQRGYASRSIHRSSLIIPRLDDVPPPPWDLRGAALLLLEKTGSGLRLLALVHYDHSPVGTYDERAVVALTRRGPSVVEMQVNSPASLSGGRINWGYPKTLARLRWQRCGERVVFTAEQKRLCARACGPSFPIRLRAWSAQTMSGRWVRVPFRLRGRARIAFAGPRVALLVEPFELCVLPPHFVGAHGNAPSSVVPQPGALPCAPTGNSTPAIRLSAD